MPAEIKNVKKCHLHNQPSNKDEHFTVANNILICQDFDNAIRWTSNQRLEQLFESRCDKVPADHIAVITEDITFTFRDLDNRANQAARYLLEQGLMPGDRVGLLFDKSIHSYVALLAVLKIGAAYVPLDESFPAERMSFIIEDANIKAIVSVSKFRQKFSQFPIQKIFLDTAEQQISNQETARPGHHEKAASEDSLFYIIYTSGTTGKPKGVAINHSGICNFVKVAGEVYGVNEQDRCYQGMTLAFDFHVEDLWVPLIAGATLIAGKSNAKLFGNDLHEFLLQQRVTYLPCVPTLWATIEQDLPDVRIILLSGESVPHNLVVKWHRPDRRILNAYGPTECSVSSTLRRLVPDCPVTIGVPLPTYTVVILDEHKDELLTEQGATGEIGIAGIALAEGYLNREDLTKEKFIPDFLNLPNNPSKRIYRTGDYGSIREDGELDFHGRIDTQIKIRGYRVELGEIEALLLQMPEIAQAVVNPYEPEPGAIELVAYYTRSSENEEISPGDISQMLRSNLPAYMIPAYFEEISQIPMTSNNKADRKNLPAPKGPRFSVSSSEFVAPSTETEIALMGALTDIMEIDKASVEDNFFEDLGAHSLLMARFGAEIRKRLKISSVSMQDVYLNPTIAKLAHHLDSLPDNALDESLQESNQASFHKPSSFSYYGCGALQFAWYLLASILGIWIIVTGLKWTYAAMPDLVETYIRIVTLALGFTLFFSVLPILAKWLLIGKWKPEAIPVWSLRYFRFWVVKSLIRSAPIARFGDPFYNLYLRLLGAKIGKNAVIRPKVMPVCTDLLSIGDNAVVAKDTILNGYKARSNYIHTGPIHIGANAIISEASILDINTIIEDDTQLGHASSLHEGQKIPKGKHFHGCPAQETTSNYCNVEAKVCTPLRRWTYATFPVITGFLFLPVVLLLVYHFLPGISDLIGNLHGVPEQSLLLLTGKVFLLSFSIYLIALLIWLLNIGFLPRFLNLFLQKDKAYVLYGVHYFIHKMIVRASNSVFFNRLFGDSSAVVYYMRWVGWKLNKIIQTGSNFGTAQRHENPFLCDIGSGTMVSGGLKMINETLSNTAFSLGLVKVEEHNYLGNDLHIPADHTIGKNTLLATKTLVPIDGSVRENVGLLGSPSFEIPRATDRDKQLSKIDDATRRRWLSTKNRYNFVSAMLFLFKHGFLISTVTVCWFIAAIYFPLYGVKSIFAATAVTFFFRIFWHWLAEKSVLGFRKLSPQIGPVLGEYFRFHERYWKMTGLWKIAPMFSGTPFKNIFSRLQGMRVGKMVFDDGGNFDEDTLIELGDYTNVNTESLIQPHSLEEAVFKSDYVKIGACCTLGCAANIHYGVTLQDYVVIEANSFVMKGEILDKDTTWLGNPAKAVCNKDFSARS